MLALIRPRASMQRPHVHVVLQRRRARGLLAVVGEHPVHQQHDRCLWKAVSDLAWGTFLLAGQSFAALWGQ
eukprot:4388570-Pyramimonas_sp.AAC.1